MEKEIKEIVRNFVNFDIEKKYYQKEDKEELVRQFKKIIYEDDTTIRQFLKSFFESTKKLAEEYSLIAKEEEAIEVPIEMPEVGEIDSEEPEEIPAEEAPEEINPESTEESIISRYRKAAADLLYE